MSWSWGGHSGTATQCSVERGQHQGHYQQSLSRIVALLQGGLEFADAPHDLPRHEIPRLYVHYFSRFTGGLVECLNVVPHGGHEFARFTGGAVVGFHKLFSPSRVACMLLDPLSPHFCIG